MAFENIKPNPPGMREKNDKTAMRIDKHNRKHQMAKKMYNAETEAHKRIGSSGPAHVRSAAENKKFYKSLKNND